MAEKDELDVRRYPREIQALIKKEIEIVKALVKGKDAVLDAGCGTGRAILDFAPLVKRYVGVDKDAEYLKKAKMVSRKYSNSKVVNGDIEKLSSSFKENEFDVVFCLFNTVSCLDDIRKALKEIRYVTKDKLYFSVCAKGSQEIRQRYYDSINVNVRFDQNETTYSSAWGAVKAYTEKEIRKICEDAGFKVESSLLIEGCSYCVTLVK